MFFFINVPSFLQKEEANNYILEFISFWEYIFSSLWINIMFFQIMTSCIRYVYNKKLSYLNVRDTWNFAWNILAMKSKLESTMRCNFLSCNFFFLVTFLHVISPLFSPFAAIINLATFYISFPCKSKVRQQLTMSIMIFFFYMNWAIFLVSECIPYVKACTEMFLSVLKNGSKI